LLAVHFLKEVKLVVHRRVAFPIRTGFFSKRKYLNPSVDHYITISKCIAQILRDYGIPSKKISVVPSAIDRSTYNGLSKQECRLKLSSEYGLDFNVPIIGMTSALT